MTADRRDANRDADVRSELAPSQMQPPVPSAEATERDPARLAELEAAHLRVTKALTGDIQYDRDPFVHDLVEVGRFAFEVGVLTSSNPDKYVSCTVRTSRVSSFSVTAFFGEDDSTVMLESLSFVAQRRDCGLSMVSVLTLPYEAGVSTSQNAIWIRGAVPYIDLVEARGAGDTLLSAALAHFAPVTPTSDELRTFSEDLRAAASGVGFRS